jgi:DHA2 family multidrug resistance protein
MQLQRHIEFVVKPDPRGGRAGLAVVLAGILALFLDASATNMINTGLPFLQGRVGATPDEGSWLLTTFNAMYYATIGLSPWLYVCVGRRRLLLISLTGFALTSLALFTVTSLDLMLLLRAVQGAFAGAIFVPAALLMFLSLPTKLLPIGIPAFALVSLAGSSAGALIGGYFAETYGASSVFLPGAAATLAVGALIALAAPNTDRTERTPFDALGFMLSIVMFGAMQFLANEGERRDWFNDSSVVFAAVILGFSGLSLGVWELAGARYPHLNLHLFARHVNLRVGAIVNVVVGFLGFSITVFVTFLEQTLGASATSSGEMIVLRVATYFVGIPLAYILILKKVLDVRVALSIAAVGTALSFVAFAHLMTSTSNLASFVLVSLVFGLFFGALNQPTPSLVLSGLPPNAFLAALPFYKLSSPIGSMLAFGVCQTFLDHRIALVQTSEAAAITLHSPSVALFMARGGTPAALTAFATGQAIVVAEAALTFMLAIATLALIPIVLFVRVPRTTASAPPTSPRETVTAPSLSGETAAKFVTVG